jgi:hypothetical protein
VASGRRRFWREHGPEASAGGVASGGNGLAGIGASVVASIACERLNGCRRCSFNVP